MRSKEKTMSKVTRSLQPVLINSVAFDIPFVKSPPADAIAASPPANRDKI